VVEGKTLLPLIKNFTVEIYFVAELTGIRLEKVFKRWRQVIREGGLLLQKRRSQDPPWP